MSETFGVNATNDTVDPLSLSQTQLNIHQFRSLKPLDARFFVFPFLHPTEFNFSDITPCCGSNASRPAKMAVQICHQHS
jgi:hypothetical protein